MDILHHFAQIIHGCIKTHPILLLLGLDNMDCYLQLSALDVLEKVVDFAANVHATIAIICKALYDGMMFFVECNLLVPILCFPLTIIVEGLQLSFCFCSLPGNMIRAKKLLIDIKEHCSTILCTFLCFM